MKRKYITSGDLFNAVIERARKAGDMQEIDEIKEYEIATHPDIRLTNHRFDMLCSVGFGGNEGVHISAYLCGNYSYDSKQAYYQPIGTIKTLHKDKATFTSMGKVAALLTFYANDYCQENINDFAL